MPLPAPVTTALAAWLRLRPRPRPSMRSVHHQLYHSSMTQFACGKWCSSVQRLRLVLGVLAGAGRPGAAAGRHAAAGGAAGPAGRERVRDRAPRSPARIRPPAVTRASRSTCARPETYPGGRRLQHHRLRRRQPVRRRDPRPRADLDLRLADQPGAVGHGAAAAARRAVPDPPPTVRSLSRHAGQQRGGQTVVVVHGTGVTRVSGVTIGRRAVQSFRALGPRDWFDYAPPPAS